MKTSAAPTPRWVIDTNVLLRGLASPQSHSRRILTACESRSAVIRLSRPVLDEYRRVLVAVGVRHKGISGRAIDLTLRRLRYLGEYYPAVRHRFAYPRDPTDAKWIELALAGGATHILTYDPDLLSLPTSRSDAGKRFRQRLRGVAVVMPDAVGM